MSEVKDIYVRGAVDLDKVLELQMEHRYGEHAVARLVAQYSGETKISPIREDSTVNIYVEREAEKERLFSGKIQSLIINNRGNDYKEIEISLISNSIMIDRKKECHSFQDISWSYLELAQKVCDEKAKIVWDEGEKHVLGKPLIQYYETDWEFIKRICSHSGMKVFADVTSEKLFLHVGYVNEHAPKELDIISSKLCFSKDCFLMPNQDIRDYMYYEVETETNIDIGRKAVVSNRILNVFEKRARIEDERLIYTYMLGGKNLICQNTIYNKDFIGRVIKGDVLSTKNETIRIKMEIDDSQDNGTAYDYPFEPESGNTMYCMPIVGTTVSLYFGDWDERNGRIINCIRTNGDTCQDMADPNNKMLTTDSNKQLALNASCLMLSCNAATTSVTRASAGNIRGACPSSSSTSTSSASSAPSVHPYQLVRGDGGESSPDTNSFSITDDSGVYAGTNKSITVIANGDVTVTSKNVSVTAPDAVNCSQGTDGGASGSEPVSYVTVDDECIQTAGDSVELELLDIYLYPEIHDEPEAFVDDGFWKKAGIGLGCVLVGALAATAIIVTGGLALGVIAVEGSAILSVAGTTFAAGAMSGSVALGGYGLNEALDHGSSDGEATTYDVKTSDDYGTVGGIVAFSSGCFSPAGTAIEGLGMSAGATAAAKATVDVVDANASGAVTGYITGDGYNLEDAAYNSLFTFTFSYGGNRAFNNSYVQGLGVAGIREGTKDETQHAVDNHLMPNGESNLVRRNDPYPFTYDGQITGYTKDSAIARFENARDRYINSKSGEYDNYLVSRGATLKCSCGTHKRKLNIRKDLGFRFMNDYIMPYVGKYQCKENQEIRYFGICKKGSGRGAPTVKLYEQTVTGDTNKENYIEGPKCELCLVGDCWLDTDTFALYKRAGELVYRKSFLACRYGGFIEVNSSGAGYRDPDPSQIKKFEYSSPRQEIYDMENKTGPYGDYENREGSY